MGTIFPFFLIAWKGLSVYNNNCLRGKLARKTINSKSYHEREWGSPDGVDPKL
jgi:hypothetical protein